MKYQATVAISFKGDRIEQGTVVNATAEEVKPYGASLVPYTETDAAPEPAEEEEVETALTDLTHDQLKAKAEELGLPKSGSKADLIERITLHEQGAEEEELSDDNQS